MKTLAAVLVAAGKPLELMELEVPPLQPGQVLVQVEFSGVCRSQLMEVRGKRGEDRYLPHLLGHEGSGVVLAVGGGVRKVKPGDRVVLGWIKCGGMDVPGPRYLTDGVTVSAGAVTTFCERTVVSENRCVRLPDGVPSDVAVLFGCALLTGAGIVMNRIRPPDGASLAVFGLGGVGLSALMAAKLFRCSAVIGIDEEEERLALARQFGASHTIHAGRQDPVEEIVRVAGGTGVDFSVEAAGTGPTIETAFRAVRTCGGLCVFASHPPDGTRIALDPFDLIRGRRIEGSWGGDCRPDADIPKLAALYRDGKLPLEKLLCRRYALGQINTALDDLERRRVVRPLIVM